MKWTDQSPDQTLPVISEDAPAATVGRQLCGNDDAAGGTEVLVDQAVYQQVLSHLRSGRRELGGLLIGRAFGDRDQPARVARVELLAAVPAAQSSGNGYSLRMEASVWTAAAERLAQHPAGDELKVVGWYHSHPGLGAFFSATDCATQAAFFNHDYSIGWVIDPHDDTHACFVGPTSRPVARCFLPGPGN